MPLCIRCRLDQGRVKAHGVVSCSACNTRTLRQKLRKSLETAREERGGGGAGSEGGSGSSRSGVTKAKDPVKVLLAYSGGPASSALLDIFQTTYGDVSNGSDGTLERFRRYERLAVLHIGEGEAIKDLLHERHVDFDQVAPLTDAGGEGDATDRLARLDTSVLDQVVHFAQERRIPIVLLGDCADRASHRVLTLVATGRVDRLAQETAPVVKIPALPALPGQSGQTVRVLRPFREVLSKELHHHLYMHDVPYIPEPLLPESGVSSIQSTTRDFLDSLQRTFPSTPMTVLATAQKLV